MRYWTPWTIALTAAGIAVAVVFWRHITFNERSYSAYLEDVVEEAMFLLAYDPLAARDDTQQAVRSVAAAAAAGHIHTPEALFTLAIQYQRESSFAEAEHLLHQVIALDPDWSWPQAALGSLLGRRDSGRLEEAEAALRQAIALDPDWSRPHNSLAVVLRLLERYDEAEASALRAIALAPDDIAAHNNYANLLVVLNRYAEARHHYEEAMRIEPENPKPPYNLACLFSIRGEEAKAVEYLRQAIELGEGARRDAALDPYFNAIRHLPEFDALIYRQEPQKQVE